MEYAYDNLNNDEKNCALQRAEHELGALWYHLVALYGNIVANFVLSEITNGFYYDPVLLGRYLADPRRSNTENGDAAHSWLTVIDVDLEALVLQALDEHPFVAEAGSFWNLMGDFEYCWGAKTAFDLRQKMENLYWGLDIEPARSNFQTFIRQRWALFHPQGIDEGAAARADSPWDLQEEAIGGVELTDDPLDYCHAGDN